MTVARVMAIVLLLFGSILHTYTQVVEASHFSIGFWLLAMSPYASLGMLFVPLLNLGVFVPIGGAIGWWVGYRIRITREEAGEKDGSQAP